jgi:hypothetical protein
MTRKTQTRILRLITLGLVTLVAVALAARIAGGPWLAFYDFIRDTSLLIVTVVAAYLAHIYQKRASFLQSLRDQWHEIVEAKAALLFYLHQENPELDDYLWTARQLSTCIDNMRIVYSNVGETDDLIGFYPYAPLHKMRKVIESMDPRIATPTPDERYRARGEIWEAFKAIREHFLDEFDLEEPTKPILVDDMRRMKRDGASPAAKTQYQKQEKRMNEGHGPHRR